MSAKGPTPSSHQEPGVRPLRRRAAAMSCLGRSSLAHLEEAHPAELGELRLVRVEHGSARCS